MCRLLTAKKPWQFKTFLLNEEQLWNLNLGSVTAGFPFTKQVKPTKSVCVWGGGGGGGPPSSM